MLGMFLAMTLTAQPALQVAPAPRAIPQPMPGCVPTVEATKPGDYGFWFKPNDRWQSFPSQLTKYWRGTGGLLMCDDPECQWCNECVYPYSVTKRTNDDRPIVTIRR